MDADRLAELYAEIESPDEETRHNAVVELGREAPANIELQKFPEFLSKCPPRIRAELRLTGRMPYPRILRTLGSLINCDPEWVSPSEPSARVRMTVIKILEQIGGNISDVRGLLLGSMYRDPSFEVRMRAAAALVKRSMNDPGVRRALLYAARDEAYLTERAVGEPDSLKPGGFGQSFPDAYAKLVGLISSRKESAKTKLRLKTFQSFVQHGSFRKVAAEDISSRGLSDDPDHTGPAFRVRRLGETIGLQLTRLSQAAARRTELTDAGIALAEWITLNSKLLA